MLYVPICANPSNAFIHLRILAGNVAVFAMQVLISKLDCVIDQSQLLTPFLSRTLTNTYTRSNSNFTKTFTAFTQKAPFWGYSFRLWRFYWKQIRIGSSVQFKIELRTFIVADEWINEWTGNKDTVESFVSELLWHLLKEYHQPGAHNSVQHITRNFIQNTISNQIHSFSLEEQNILAHSFYNK